MSVVSIVDEIRARYPDLPFGIEIKNDQGGNILVANQSIGFAITAECIQEGRHFDQADTMLPDLIRRLKNDT